MTNHDKKLKVGFDVINNIKDPIPKKPAIMGEWLRPAELHMLYAPRGAGKTYISMLLADALASGNDLFGWQCKKKLRVLYLDGEMGKLNSARRFREIELNPNFINSTASGNLYCFCYDHCPNTLMFNMSDQQGQIMYNKIISHHKPDIVFIDNLNTIAHAINSRDTDFDVWQRVQRYILFLKSKGITVFLVHHAGKSGLQLGTIQKENIMDSIIRLSHSKIKDDNYPTSIDFQFEKERHFSKFDAPDLHISFTIKKSEYGDDYFDFKYQTLFEARCSYVQELIDTGFKERAIKEHLGLSAYEYQKIMNNKLKTINENNFPEVF